MIFQGLKVEDGYFGIEGSNFGAYRLRHLFRFDSRARDQNHVRAVVLEQGQIEKWLGRLPQAAVLYILGDANDFQPILGQFYAPPKGIPSGPVASRHRLVDDHHTGSAVLISFIEVPAMRERDAHRLKILWADGFIVEAHVFVLSRCVAVDRDAGKRNSVTGEGQASRQGRRLNARQRPDALDQTAIEVAPVALVVASQERVERSEQNAMRIKSRISPVRLTQTADK